MIQPIVQRAGAQVSAPTGTTGFPRELVQWSPERTNPVFVAAGPNAWDAKIRERGWILRDNCGYRLWYTGYDGTREGIKRLGYATSPDGLHWTRWPNPLVPEHWIEDMMVAQHGDTYYMFAEGADSGHAELFTSRDGIEWTWHGPLDIRLSDGMRAAKKPSGTPTVWVENGVWYLFYEWHDRGVWLATTRDPLSLVWINVTDEPILVPGPADHDGEMIAVDQVIKYHGAYFAFFHACGSEVPRVWSTNIARSHDLVHWQKFAGNPIVASNKSSGIVVPVGRGLRLYTMHDQVDVFYSRVASVARTAGIRQCQPRAPISRGACPAGFHRPSLLRRNRCMGLSR